VEIPIRLIGRDQALDFVFSSAPRAPIVRNLQIAGIEGLVLKIEGELVTASSPSRFQPTSFSVRAGKLRLVAVALVGGAHPALAAIVSLARPSHLAIDGESVLGRAMLARWWTIFINPLRAFEAVKKLLMNE
jgi:hypothetical protein